MATRNDWAKRVREWRASGLTSREFAAREGMNANTLKWWASRLSLSTAAKFVDVTAIMTPPRTPPSSSLEVIVRESVRIRVDAGFDADHLRAVVSALETR